MIYTVSYQLPHHQFINIEWQIETVAEPQLTLQLPTWRPGRYETQAYAKNLRRLTVATPDGQPLPVRKTGPHTWLVTLAQPTGVVVRYQYFAQQLDAGGSWLGDDFLYLNPVNCLLYVPGREHEPCTCHLHVPATYQIACALPPEGATLRASSYRQLADSPLLAAPHLQHRTYQVPNATATFHLWLLGAPEPDWQRLLLDFETFTHKHIEVMGGQPADFPSPAFHFIGICPAWTYYHGVEHRDSTVLVLGPAAEFNTPKQYDDWLGLASHELFHYWNVCRIRPAELQPYDLSRPAYFHTGYVAEGLTTYYGDYLLARAGVWDMPRYFQELSKLVTQHIENPARLHMSVREASWDLWLDGYVPGVPGRKVSIYTEGAVLALLLDLELRRLTNNQRSLDHLMRHLWQHFGQTGHGYTEADYQQVVETVAGQPLPHYFALLHHPTDLVPHLQRALAYVACELIISPSEQEGARFGFKAETKAGRTTVTRLAPNSPAYQVLAYKDRLLSVDGEELAEGNLNQLLTGKTDVIVKIMRHEQERVVLLKADGGEYLPDYEVSFAADFTEAERENFESWMLS
ncbi:MAG: M61 family peptidase [Bernardetiaceae bacterium]|nr:M61 family peptidase [Bernardetiaceae bacterium]